MKRLLVALMMMAGFAVVSSDVTAAPNREEVPPVALNGENGILDIIVYLGDGASNSSVPMMGTIPVKVCDGSDCETYTANYVSDTEGYSMHRSISPRVTIGERFARRPVTAQVPTDLVNGANGWSAASNAVTGWTDSADWFRSRVNRPLLEVQFKGIDKSSITRADLCANYRPDATLSSTMSGYSVFDLAGYTSIKYTLFENGSQLKTEDLSSALSSMSSIPACGGGVLGSGLLRNIDGLTAGRSYKLIYTVTGPGKTDLIATLDFVAPGACPTGEIVLAASPRPFHFGLLGTDGTLKSMFSTGTYPWRLESIVGSRIAPIYFSASKVGPYKGNLYGIRDQKEKWRYVPEMDDWALVVDSAVPVTAANMLSYTVFGDCQSSSLKSTLTLDETVLKAADQACEIDANEVVPVKAGQCMVKAEVTPAGVSSSAVRSRSTPAAVSMNYVFNSLGTFTRTRMTVTPAAPISAKVRACTTKLAKTKKTATATTLLKCAKLSRKSGQTVALKVSSRSNKVCRVVRGSIVRRGKGTCTVTVSIKRGSRTLAKSTVSLRSV